MKFFLYFYFSFPFSFQKKFFVTENTIIPERLNIIVKKILIIILFSIIPEARYEKNIIKNSTESSPPEKLTGKAKTFPSAKHPYISRHRECTQDPAG